MKTRLPLSLRAALVAALSATVVSAAPYYDSIDGIVYDGVYTPEDTKPALSHCIAKDGDGVLTFTGTDDFYSTLYIREGEMRIGDGETATNVKFNPAGYFNDLGTEGRYIGFSVGGKDAVLRFNKATVTSVETGYGVGGHNGNGLMIVENGSDVNLGGGNVFMVGDISLEEMTDPNTGIPDGYNNATTATPGASVDSAENLYKGNYSTAKNGSGYTFGRGDVIVRGASKFNATYGNFWIGEGSFTAEGKGTVVEVAHLGYRAWFGLGDNSTSELNVVDGAVMDIMVPEFYSNNGQNSTSIITVSGKESVLTFDSPRAATDYAHFGATGSTGSLAVLNVEKEGTVYLNCDKTYFGGSGTLEAWGREGADGRKAVVNIANDSHMYVKSMYTGAGADINNEGNIEAVNIQMEDGVVNNSGTIEVDTLSMSGGVLNNAGTLNVKEQLEIAKTATLNCLAGSTISGVMPTGCTYAFTLSARNLSVAGTTLAAGTEYSTATPLTLKLEASENLLAGKYMLLDATQGVQTNRAATPAEIESVTGLGAKKEDIVWEDGILYFYLGEQLLVAHDPLADAVQAANWGVYKSSQAFTSLLWAPRPNAVVVKNIETPTADGKGSIMTTEVEGRTLAWGSVYSSFSRNSSSGAFAGAEYSIFGGAIGVERQFACGSSIGAAFGYDWGKASPFSTSRVDQESWHAALYGRAAEWKLGQKSSVALDWSAAVGSTTSEHKALGSDWTQENIQLDARATYTYALTERTALSAFVGAQYYAQNDDSTERVEADSLQNLRLMVGGGISHKLTEKTTLFGEAMLFNDTMRHNPDVTLDGFNYGTGANPGRLGGSVTAGAQYQLTPDWTLRGSYSYEGAENNNEHRVNVGAVYSF